MGRKLPLHGAAGRERAGRKGGRDWGRDWGRYWGEILGGEIGLDNKGGGVIVGGPRVLQHTPGPGAIPLCSETQVSGPGME